MDNYPPAPWRLHGRAVQMAQLISTELARRVVPAELRIVSLVPGKTLAAVYVGRYGPGSTLQYDELIVAPAVVRRGAHYGMWVTHIYVNDPASAAGGRAIWGLPKELAEFEWQTGRGGVTVRQGERMLCRLGWQEPRWLWRVQAMLPVISLAAQHLLQFRIDWRSRCGIGPVDFEVPGESPLAGLQLGSHGLPYHHGELEYEALPPRVIGHVASGPPLRAG